MFRRIYLGGVISAVSLAVAAAPAAAANAPATHDCFFVTQWQGWKSPSPTVLYLKVNRAIYRVDLSVGSQRLSAPGVHLTSRLTGSSVICRPLDLDLAVVDSQGAIREPLIAKSLTRLTSEEAAAIPPKYRP